MGKPLHTTETEVENIFYIKKGKLLWSSPWRRDWKYLRTYFPDDVNRWAWHFGVEELKEVANWPVILNLLTGGENCLLIRWIAEVSSSKSPEPIMFLIKQYYTYACFPRRRLLLPFSADVRRHFFRTAGAAAGKRERTSVNKPDLPPLPAPENGAQFFLHLPG